MTARAAFPPGDAREDWAILRALSATLGKVLPFDTLTELRASLYKAFPHLQRIGAIEPGALDEVVALAGKDARAANFAYGNRIGDFYLTNPIARASAVMAECSALAAGRPALAAE
jgi:NADH-quinone oxidoreductase subunit G